MNMLVSESFAKHIFVVSVVFLLSATSFVYGVAVERRHIWPYETINSIWQAAKSVAKYGELVPGGRRVIPPENASRETMTIHRADRISDGYYVFVGWDSTEELYAAWLYDIRGQRRHTWRIDYYALDPDGPSNGAENPHPFHVLGDGSIIVGFDKGDVMARLDACGEPIWIKEGIYHHAMSPTDDGSYWVWRGDGTAYGHYNYLENFDPETGATIRELDLIRDIVAPTESTAVLFGVRPDYPFRRYARDQDDTFESDLFHPNDVESLSFDLAPMFPMFEAGDLLLSFRSLNLVAVLDPDNSRLKWWSHGPWIGQHDPDFTPDGKISVYNNNGRRGRSEILTIDPMTQKVSNNLLSGEVSFKSAAMGKHQYLPNRNVLIVVPGEGRVLEVTEDGKMVMEFNNLSSHAGYNEHVENGTWVPPDYLQTLPDCSENTR